MISVTVEPNDVRKIAIFAEHIRTQIRAALSRGMREAFNDLAAYIIANKLSGNPIGQQAASSKYSNPGDLRASILHGVRVTSTDELVRGTLTGKPKGMPNIGLWQEFGTSHPERIAKKLNVFIGRDGKPVFRHHFASFVIAPRPFLNPSFDEQKSQIIETIRARLAEADLSGS